MHELINREQAGKNICKYCASEAYCKEDDCMVYQGLRDTPTIQIEPEVRHGRMIEGRYPNENKCSECGQIFRDDIQFIYPYDENSICKTPKRCPECGCYWEGGADNG